MTAQPLAARLQRARKDPIATLIAALAEVGVRFRVSGADFIADGVGRLPRADRALLEVHIGTIRERLAPAGACDADAELITDEARAREVVASLPASVGFDIETEPLPEHAPAPVWLAITRDGRLAKNQPQLMDRAGLDPHRARPRLAQIYDPGADETYVVDLRPVPLEALDGLWSRRLVVHNAAFELAMLHGRPQNVIDTMQLAGLLYGTGRGARMLASVAKAVLGWDMPKDLQTSDWSADRLSGEQIAYAALDAQAAIRAGRRMYARLDADTRRAFAAQNAAVPVVAAMRVAGIPFDLAVHRETVAVWEHEQAEARAAFVNAAGEEVPQQGPRRAAWLEAKLEALEAGELQWWHRNDTGTLKTGADHLKRLAGMDWARPLITVADAEHRLRAFGRKLIEAVSPVTGRLHGDFMPCGQKAGRTSCRNPNLMGLPAQARRSVVAPPGRVLVVADYNQVELRVAAELSGDPAMRQVFRAGGDLHRLTAAAISGVAEADVLPAMRQAAKPVNYGTLYGQGAQGLRATAWSDYGIDMSLAEAERARAALRARYPTLIAWQRRMVDQAQATGVLRSVLGRPLRAEWELSGRIRYTLACNFPVQASAADVMLVAMAKVAASLAGLDARVVLQVHDELMIEAAEVAADDVRDLLREAMAAAWREVFPAAPETGIVDVKSVRCWADAKD